MGGRTGKIALRIPPNSLQILSRATNSRIVTAPPLHNATGRVRRYPRVAGFVVASLSLLIAGPASFSPSATAAANAVSPEQALDIFFQLGLPDTRGAKWMKAYGPGISHREMLPGRNFSGNAWLVREEAERQQLS